jgi:hypothetical protein
MLRLLIISRGFNTKLEQAGVLVRMNYKRDRRGLGIYEQCKAGFGAAEV